MCSIVRGDHFILPELVAWFRELTYCTKFCGVKNSILKSEKSRMSAKIWSKLFKRKSAKLNKKLNKNSPDEVSPSQNSFDESVVGAEKTAPGLYAT